MLKIGDKVEWTSGGITKVGVVLWIIPAGERPLREDFPRLYSGAGIGCSRDHVSYVVGVGTKYYWPRVSGLKEIKP